MIKRQPIGPKVIFRFSYSFRVTITTFSPPRDLILPKWFLGFCVCFLSPLLDKRFASSPSGLSSLNFMRCPHDCFLTAPLEVLVLCLGKIMFFLAGYTRAFRADPSSARGRGPSIFPGHLSEADSPWSSSNSQVVPISAPMYSRETRMASLFSAVWVRPF